MRTKLLCIAILTAAFTQAQTAIFSPGMNITPYNVLNSPAGEDLTKAIDGDVNTKLLDFDETDGMGFTVDIGATAKIATSIEITTANDAIGRDPQDYEVYGSNDGVTFVSIATGTIPCISDRFFARTYNFSNSTAYSYYRINFPDNECNAVEGIIQIAEVQLYEPAMSINDEAYLASQFSIYPNANNGVFTLTYTGKEKINSVKIYNTTGKLIETIHLKNFQNNKTLRLKNNGAGIYFAQINTNSSSIVKRILVK